MVHFPAENTQSAADAVVVSGHTPGPWDYVPANEHHGPYVTTDYGSTVADLYVLSEPVVWASEARKPIHFMHEMAEANARLIAAAPDLLEACRDLLNSPLTNTNALLEAKEKARAAIARATAPSDSLGGA